MNSHLNLGDKINIAVPMENTDDEIRKVSNALDLLHKVIFWGLLDRLTLVNYDLSDVAINTSGEVILVASVIGSNRLVQTIVNLQTTFTETSSYLSFNNMLITDTWGMGCGVFKI